MRHIIVIILITWLIPLQGIGQTFAIDTGLISFENKLRNCLSVQYDAPPRTVKKAWADYMKKRFGIKTKGIGLFSNSDLIQVRDVTIHEISDKRMDCYARITGVASGSQMKYFMSFGYDFFIGPENYPGAFESMRKLLYEFSIGFLNTFYADETTGMLRLIKKYESEIRKNNRLIEKNIRKAGKSSVAVSSALEAKNNSLHMEIRNYQERINNLQGKLEEIKKKQAGLRGAES
ncbi:MAG: hypothetical protein ACO25B_11385 [Chitinophagaceae bacterium]